MQYNLSMESIELALTFDDILLLPARSDVLPQAAQLQTRFTRNLKLNIPLLSAAMDTVTGANTAICLAQEGGVGVIHRHFSPAEQAREVSRVKKFASGVIRDPVTVGKAAQVSDVLKLMRQYDISGVPVVDGDKPIGIVTSRDLRFQRDMQTSVCQVMTPRERLVTAPLGASAEQIEGLLHQHRIEKVLLVDQQGRLAGLVTVKDIQKSSDYPNACKDRRGQLLAAAAVGVGADADERVELLVNAGVDAIVVDTAHGHSNSVLERVRQIKRAYPQVDVVGGNVGTAEAARDLVEVGADAVKVGIGPGSICTTRIVAGVGVPQVHALRQVAEGLRGTDVPFIADGGIRYSGDLAKCIAAGAHCAMVGGLLAGTDEAPGEIEIYQGRSYKSYRGMGSLGVMSEGSRDRYFQSPLDSVDKLVPEGIEGRVPYKGSAVNIVRQLMGGLRSSMGYTGNATIEQMRTRTRFVRITSAGMRESHVHDVSIVKEAPNYRHT